MDESESSNFLVLGAKRAVNRKADRFSAGSGGGGTILRSPSGLSRLSSYDYPPDLGTPADAKAAKRLEVAPGCPKLGEDIPAD